MIRINPIFIDEILSPLSGGADDEETIELYGHYKSDLESEVKKLASDILLPEFNKQKEILQKAVKDTLAYYLTYPNKVDFESIFNSLLLPIETPKNSKLFFEWIWELFFDYESKDYIKEEIIEEYFDVSAPFKLKKDIN